MSPVLELAAAELLSSCDPAPSVAEPPVPLASAPVEPGAAVDPPGGSPCELVVSDPASVVLESPLPSGSPMWRLEHANASAHAHAMGTHAK
jgi:hypothetical protein